MFNADLRKNAELDEGEGYYLLKGDKASSEEILNKVGVTFAKKVEFAIDSNAGKIIEK